MCLRSVLAVVLTALFLLPQAGCSMLLTAAYLLEPADVPAEFAGLAGKKVAVVCRPIIELEFSDAHSARELAGLVGSQIEASVRKAKVVKQQEVARWIDEHGAVEYPALGKALDADFVVGIDLEGFRLHEGATLYRGKATAHVRVFDVKKKTVAFEKRLDDYTFPSDGAIPATDRTEIQFRALFLQMLSLRISRCFHAYESRETFASENLTF
ncbi:MAG: hypothetical protein ACK6CT_14230 [Planctomycetia bacterium]|jgi:hypothetical protein